MSNPVSRIGTVFLVGAGPGDPDLLTLRAARLVMNAKVLVHDGLVDAAILAMARPTARMISVAKSRSRHTMPQSEINALLVGEVLKRLTASKTLLDSTLANFDSWARSLRPTASA